MRHFLQADLLKSGITTAKGIINNEISARRMGPPRGRVYVIRGRSLNTASTSSRGSTATTSGRTARMSRAMEWDKNPAQLRSINEKSPLNLKIRGADGTPNGSIAKIGAGFPSAF